MSATSPRARSARTLPVALGVAAALILALAASRAGGVMDGARAFDRIVLTSLREPGDPADPIGPPALEHAVADVTALGGYAVLTLIVAGAALYLAASGRWRNGFLVAAAALSGGLVSETLKSFYARQRPTLVTPLVDVVSASFPSGHAMLSAIVFLSVGALLARVQPRRRLKALIYGYAVVMTLMVGLSRVYLGVHWPTDVIAGWIFGAAWASLWQKAADAWTNPRSGDRRPVSTPPR